MACISFRPLRLCLVLFAQEDGDDTKEFPIVAGPLGENDKDSVQTIVVHGVVNAKLGKGQEGDSEGEPGVREEIVLEG